MRELTVKVLVRHPEIISDQDVVDFINYAMDVTDNEGLWPSVCWFEVETIG